MFFFFFLIKLEITKRILIIQSQVYLRDWAIQTEWIVISVDYHTAPEFKFPVQIDEGWSVYELLIEGKLGFRPHRIILVGDSAGGTIASSVILRAIQEKARIPDGLVMFYPALNLTPSPTPSRLMNCLDTLSTKEKKNMKIITNH